MFDSDRPADDDEGDGTYQVPVAEHENPSEAVVRAATAMTGVDPAAADPLYERVDPEALDAVFEDARTVRRGTVYFEYCGCEVAVEDGDRVALRPLDREGPLSD